MNRMDALRRRLPQLGADAFFCTTPSNVRYLTGFTGSAGAALVTSDRAWFVTDFRYKTQSAEQVKGCEILISKRGLTAGIALIAARRKLKRVAYEAGHLTVEMLEDARKKFKRARLVLSNSFIESLRLQKEPRELDPIRKAVEIADRGYDFILGRIRPSRTERDIAFELEQRMLQLGADALAFKIIVASGLRSAMPHGIASNKKIEKGDLVTIDFGAVCNGYCSDITRTVCVGKPTREQQKIYSIVRDAQQRAKEKIRSGLSCKAADKAARDYIESHGHKEHFGHGLGHGVGLDIHEAPRLSPLGKGKLKAMNVVTLEPGIYIEGWGGVRVEDMAVVKEDGAEILTQAPNPARIPSV